jgi:hypothetical protein
MKKNLLRGALVAVALLLLLWLFERWHVTDQERVEAAWDDLVAAFQDEDPARMRARFHPELRYDGPRIVGQGDASEAMVALARFWDEADGSKVVTRTNEIRVQGAVASNLASAVVRFHYGSSVAIYKVRVQVAWAADGETWRARDIDVLELTPGLF